MRILANEGVQEALDPARDRDSEQIYSACALSLLCRVPDKSLIPAWEALHKRLQERYGGESSDFVLSPRALRLDLTERVCGEVK